MSFRFSKISKCSKSVDYPQLSLYIRQRANPLWQRSLQLASFIITALINLQEEVY